MDRIIFDDFQKITKKGFETVLAEGTGDDVAVSENTAVAGAEVDY
jgi:hypothetical protein